MYLLILFASLTSVFSDKIVKSPQVVRSVNYDDFSLLCADGIPLLMEDHKPRPCQPRPWLPEQKCPTGFWCHEGNSEASFYCCPNSRKFANRCHLPPAVGYGKQRMRRFYFDWKTDACHELQYSGIGGNENAFMDYEKCENACRGAGEPSILLPSNMKVMPKEIKPEKEKKVIYPKEASAGIDLKPPAIRIHGSVSTLAPRTEPPKSSTTRTWTSTTEEEPTTTTTEAVPEPEPEPEEVLDPNPCVLAPERGQPGSLAITMWYFDTASLACSPFLFLGKGGNSNRFDTSEQCMEACGIGKPTRKSCDLPAVIGNGPFNIPRYYFDQITRKCERFFYSGRDGNANRFHKKAKCERLCLRKKPKKKENLYGPSTFSTSTTSTSEPIRIVQNLKASYVPDSESPTTETYKNWAVTVEGIVESSTVQEEFEFTTKSHPTLISHPRGETIPTIIPPTTTPDIADRVFSSLMTAQQHKIEEPPIGVITPSPMVNSYGMKVDQTYPHPPVYLPHPTPYSHQSIGESVIIDPSSVAPPVTTMATPTTTIFVPPTTSPPTPSSSTTNTPTILSSSTIGAPSSTNPPFTFSFVNIESTTTTTTTTAAPTITTTPIPTLLPPNVTTMVPNNFPCLENFYGEPTIMCETRPAICPLGTFCQIGQGQSICCPIIDVPPCDQELEEGVGTSLIRRWSFDPTTRLCQPFYFKGFKGNQNNFQSFDECNRACGATNICPIGTPQLSIHTHLLSCSSNIDCPLSYQCIQSTPHNLCCAQQSTSAPPPQVPQVSFELPTNMVLEFLPSSSCEQPIDVGYGGFAEHRWAFDNGQCISFLYRGQGGNMNNYLTRNDCVKKCQSGLSAERNQCSQPAASGNGDQYLSRFFYSPEYRQCLHFIYSGEGGNANNFESLNQCLEVCVANGVRFSSLANPVPTPIAIPPIPPIPLAAAAAQMPFKPRLICPQGDPLVTINGMPIQCDHAKAAKCPGDHICTPNGQEAYCCPSPMNFCLQNRPAISVCTGPDFQPIKEIRFTYDPLADRCIRFSFQNCRGSSLVPPNSLNNFVSKSQCNRLCCNQGYNLVYKRRLLMAMNDEPIPE